MAEVSGSITGSDGTKDIRLNNAATESTLKLLLQSNLAANKQSIDNIKALAQKSGLDPAAVAAANTNIQKVSASGSKLGTGFEALGFAAGYASKAFNEVAALTSKLASGSAEASDVFASLSKVGVITGAVFSGMQKLAAIQESYLKTYQDLSNSGVNFSGSLTQMRLAASSTYMTLDGFSKLVTANSDAFAKMGGTANAGALAFTKVAADMQKGKIGDQLRALGYTSDQANQGLVNYIAATGGRNKQEMQDTKALSAAAGEYMSQLDALAQLTGKSRSEQESQLKEASANEAYQAKLLTLDEEGKKKAQAAMQNALATGGKAGADLFKSQMLGLPPMTEAAQKLQALGPNVANGIRQMGNAVLDSGKTIKDVERGRAVAQAGATEDMKKFGGVVGALSYGSDSTSQALMGLQASANMNTRNGIKNADDAERQMAKITNNQKTRDNSEAAVAAKAKKRINELGQQILDKLMPIFATLIAYVNKATIYFVDFVEYLKTSPALLKGLGIAAVTLTAAFVAYNAVMAAAKVKELADMAKRLKDTGLSAAMSKPGLSPKNPLYVYVVNQPGSGFETPDGKGGKGAKAGVGKRILGGLKGGVGGIVGGLALDYAGEKLKENGQEKPAAYADIASSALSMAGTGAMIGSIFPGVGTAVGGALGGAVGAGYGAYQNWGTLTGPDKEKIKQPAAATPDTLATAGPSNTVTAPETIKSEELLRIELKTLNKTMADLLRYMMETAEYTRRNYNATRSLDGNMFARP